MAIIDKLIKRVSQRGIIAQKTKLSENIYHIRIQDDNVREADFLPGYFLRVGVGIGDSEATFKDKVRSYSVWNIDKQRGTIDIAIATHSMGIGASWVRKCEIDDAIYYVWKKGNFFLDDNADSFLMIGDLSALAHLYVIGRNLPKERKVEGIIYSGSMNECYGDIDGKTPFQFYEMPHNPYESIISKVKEIVPGLPGRKMVYIGGDSRVCVALNQYFKQELYWSTKQIKTKPFWNPDKKGLE